MSEPTHDDAPPLQLALPQDYPAIAEMHVRAWTQTYRGLIDSDCLRLYSADAFVGQYETLVAHGHRITAIIDNDIPLGVAIFHPSAGKIEALYVGPRRQGIGTRLLGHACTSMSTDTVTLECAKGNDDGCRYWERRGFLRAGTGEPFDPECSAAVPTWRYVWNRAAPPSRGSALSRNVKASRQNRADEGRGRNCNSGIDEFADTPAENCDERGGPG